MKSGDACRLAKGARPGCWPAEEKPAGLISASCHARIGTFLLDEGPAVRPGKNRQRFFNRRLENVGGSACSASFLFFRRLVLPPVAVLAGFPVDPVPAPLAAGDEVRVLLQQAFQAFLCHGARELGVA